MNGSPTGNPEEWLVGLHFKDAEQLLRDLGMSLRVVRHQGCPWMVTADFNPFRWNVATDVNNVIEEAMGRG